MKTKEVNEIRSIKKGHSNHKHTALIDNSFTKGKGSKNQILKDLRLKLGKSKEQFYRIFELYNQLTKYKNI